MNTILIQKDDVKSELWGREARRLGYGSLVPVKGSPLKFPFYLLHYLLRGRGLDAVCLRYLNDYPSFSKSFLRFLTDTATVLMAKLMGRRVLWICHNVDKETNEYFPKLVGMRRYVLIKLANRIFVTDRLLIDSAVRILGVDRARVDVVSFGLESDQRELSVGEKAAFERVKAWRAELGQESGVARVGLWIGSLESKKLAGLLKAVELAEEAKRRAAPLYFVIIGPVRKWLSVNAPDLISRIEGCENILFIGDGVDMRASLWADVFDFVWKPLDDLSVSLTAFNSATAAIPIFCESDTFMGGYVEEYGIGYAVDFSEVNCQAVLDALNRWSPERCKSFLGSHTWENGAAALFRG